MNKKIKEIEVVNSIPQDVNEKLEVLRKKINEVIEYLNEE